MVKLSSDVPSRQGSTHSTGFRLQDFQDDRLERESATSVSGYSIYKQRIDSMFDETRSQMSGCGAQSINNGKTIKEDVDDDHQLINNTVQARIEKMFAEVTKIEDVKDIGSRFPVKYLGSVALKDKVTSLHGLQEPLKELYLMKRARVPGTIEISREGLRVKDDLKPFQSIAVWAAVQFVLRKTNRGAIEYAFLPLIADPEAVDKGSLFKELVSSKGTILESKHGLENPPIFAVVMRRHGSHKVLECHAFICSCSEDAIVIAANLYQALMTNMQKRHKKTPKNKNGVSYVSIGGSSQCGSNIEARSNSVQSIHIDAIEVVRDVEVKPVKIAPKVPVRPPRQKKKSVSSSDGEDVLVEDANVVQTPRENVNNRTSAPESTNRIRRTVSETLVSPEIIDRGDILTKIVIPRSQSFLNPGGALMRYTRSQRQNEGPSQGSPLGFHELFTEFRIQEGLHSLDDILDVIIDADGMSFNDLKPIYKEFLMKLAVTLTKDELYQRSKNIMRRQRKKLERRDNRKSNIKKAFKRSVSKFKPTPTTKTSPNFEFTSVLFPTAGLKKKKLGYTTTSSSSYGSRKRASRRQSTRRRSLRRGPTSTSEDSDFFSMSRENKGRERASSGYISCSECSFDSEFCSCKDKCYCSKAKAKAAINCSCDTDSCMESDKCYCKKATNVFEQLKQRGFAASESSASRTDSPTPKPEVNYSKSKKHLSVKSTKSLEFLQIKPKWDTRDSIYQKRMDVYESLPVIQHGVTRTQRKSYSTDNLALDYDLFSKCRERKVLVVSARDTRGRIIYNKTSDAQKSTPNDALSVKKSAEIAALFHDVKFRQENEIFYNTLEPPPEYFTMKSRNHKSDLEISLGYLP